MNKEELEKIKQKALQEHIPIIMDETLEVIEKYLKENPEILDEVESKVRSNAEKAFEESLGEEIPEIDMDDDGEE